MDNLYNEIFNRNFGLISNEEQKKLKQSKAVIFGVGGLGGVISEVLVRSGIENLTIIDRDRFEESNLNRQIFAFTDTIGKDKVQVTEDFLKKINPGLNIEKHLKVDSANISEIMQSADVAMMALDDVVPIVIISRYARERDIPLVEGWAIPFGNVRVFTKNTPTLEEVYHLNLNGKNPEKLSREEQKTLNMSMLYELKKIAGISEYYPEQALQRINQGQIPSFAPMVWLTAVLMSFEAVKILLNRGTIAYAPEFVLYDPFKHNQLHK